MSRRTALILLGVAVFLLVSLYTLAGYVFTETYKSGSPELQKEGAIETASTNKDVPTQTQESSSPNAAASTVSITHVATPSAVKALYMSSWVAATPSFRAKLVNLIDTTELNTVVLDIKDATGKISFLTHDASLTELGSTEKRISDIDQFIADLHAKGVYVIGRIAVFQDPFITEHKPEWAIKKKSDGTVWKDFKGLSFLDPSNADVRKYIVAIAKESYAHGFDEINFDYVRFPSDGKISDIAYPNTDGTTTRADIIESFFVELKQSLAGTGIVTSADLFGLVTVSTDDLGIGQVLERALPHFDYICPMVYPSHFAAGWNGYQNPAEHPYEVIKESMAQAVERAKAIGQDPQKLRPWIQDFNIGAVYTAEKVRDQIRGTYDVGLDSWLLWSAANKYTAGALEKE